MLNLKSNVYRSEWLDLVFEGRNKVYGAYQLRQQYSTTLVKAMLVSATLFVGLIAGPFLYGQFVKETMPMVVTPGLIPVDTLTVYTMPKALPQPKQAAAAPAIKQNTVKSFAPVVVPARDVVEEMPTQAQLQTAIIGSENVKGDAVLPGTNAVDAGTGTGSTGQGISDAPASNEPFMVAEQMPEFPGGQEAFAKYLSKNLRYPAQAQDNDIHGRVTVSFVVETDGSLSNIHILRGIGAGCDEEAMRVIKKAPAWKPGKQNGQNVRVMYNVPIVFNLGN